MRQENSRLKNNVDPGGFYDDKVDNAMYCGTKMLRYLEEEFPIDVRG